MKITDTAIFRCFVQHPLMKFSSNISPASNIILKIESVFSVRWLFERFSLQRYHVGVFEILSFVSLNVLLFLGYIWSSVFCAFFQFLTPVALSTHVTSHQLDGWISYMLLNSMNFEAVLCIFRIFTTTTNVFFIRLLRSFTRLWIFDDTQPSAVVYDFDPFPKYEKSDFHQIEIHHNVVLLRTE